MKRFSSNRNYAKQTFAFPCHFSIRNSIDEKRNLRLSPQTVLQIYVLRMLDTNVNLYLSGTSSITVNVSSYALKNMLYSILIRSNPRNTV